MVQASILTIENGETPADSHNVNNCRIDAICGRLSGRFIKPPPIKPFRKAVQKAATMKFLKFDHRRQGVDL